MQGCLLSPSLFCLEEHDGQVSIGGRTLTNLLFVVDIDSVAEEKQKLKVLVKSLYKTCTRSKMEMCAEKTYDNQHQWHSERDQG